MPPKEMPIGVCNTGSPPNYWVALIKYECTDDGLHIFSSDSIPGLLVASKDAKTVMRQLQPTIEALLKANLKVEKCSVFLGNELKEFEKKHHQHSPIKAEVISLSSTYAIINMAA